MAEEEPSTKRRRQVDPTIDDVLHKARFLMNNDPFKASAPAEEERCFRALFGCTPQIVLTIWIKLLEMVIVPEGGTMMHLLWTLLYAKTYAKWKTMKKMTKTDPKTLRKWIWKFFDAVEQLQGDVIDWRRRKTADRLNDCLVSVDGVDFPVPWHGRKFVTHKWRFKGALRYEAAVSILSGDLVWINGPYEPGKWNDIMIFRNGIMSLLEEGERVEADDGYRGESPRHVKCPRSIGQDPATVEMQQLVRSRHETVNKRFKQWQILKQCYRGELQTHGKAFRLVAVITQLCILNGEPLFSVDYQDPYINDYYFDEEDTDDEDD